MKRLIALIPVLGILFYSCASQPDESENNIDSEFSRLLEDYHQENIKFFPINATMAGDNRYNDTIPNYLDPQFKEVYHEFLKSTKANIAKYTKPELNKGNQVSYDVLNWELNIAIEGLGYNDDYLPMNQFSSLNLFVGQLASGASIQPFKTVEDYDNWLSRMDDFVVWSASALSNMQSGAELNIVLPKSLVVKTIPQAASYKNGPVEDHLFFKPINNLPDDFSDEDKERLTNAYREAIETKIMPAYENIYNFLSTDYLAAARETSGLGELANGEAWYNYLIKYYTTTTMTSDEIFKLGESEVARITKEMELIKTEVGFDGDLKEFFAYVRTRPELMPFSEPQEVLDNFALIHETMLPQLEKLFDKTPKTAFEVRRTEKFRENSASAEYNPGSIDGTRPGVFYVPIPDVKSYNTLSDEDLFLHEAIPGHHYQISLQQEDESIPSFRKSLWYSAYGEGWALYTESLGSELGLYTDPYQYFGMLSAEMHRAIRLVVDAGMHTKGWTREQAIQYSLDHEAESEGSITAEIERYMAIPGQALSYKIGQLKIRELRSRAEETLGDKFDIKQFHNIVLESGCIPLVLLEAQIDGWIVSVASE